MIIKRTVNAVHELTCINCLSELSISIDDVNFENSIIHTDCMGNDITEYIPYVICPICDEKIKVSDKEFTKKEYRTAFEKNYRTDKNDVVQLLHS